MTVNVELWQVILGLLVLMGAWTATVVKTFDWVNRKLASLQPASEYERRHQELEQRVYHLELWRATKESRVDWRESEP